MYGCCGHIECVEVHAKEVGCIPITSSRCLDLPISVFADAVNEDIKVSCRVLCSIPPYRQSYWMWNAGEILYWDNNEKITLEDGIDN